MKVAKVAKYQQQAAEYPNMQIAVLLLINCFHACRTTYLARTTPTNIIAPALSRFDTNLRDAFNTAFAYTLNDKEWAQLTFSISQGGHGARTISTIAKAAYLASFDRC